MKTLLFLVALGTVIVVTQGCAHRNPDTADAKWINMWLDDWGVHLDDRLDFARRLYENGAKEEFFESTKENTQISKSLNGFAETNKMESCSTPGDV